jgi:dienelactone hydrolase
VVLAHALAGNSGGAMSVQARHLARAGYAVVLPEFRGHGRNRRPGEFTTLDTPPGLLEDLDAAVLYARMQRHFNAERIAVAGYAMGARGVLAYGGRDPSVAAVIAISGGEFPEGPYPVPNVLMIWAAGEPDAERARYRKIGAELANRERLVLDRTYGEPLRGTGVRLSELAGTDHFTIPYSTEAARRILAWLQVTLGSGASGGKEPASDGRFGWSALGFLAAVVLLWGLIGAIARLLPRDSLPTLGSPLSSLAVLCSALLATVVLAAGVDSTGTHGPFGFVPLAAGRDLVAFFAVSGALIWIWLALRGRINSQGLRDVRRYAAAGVLLVSSYLLFGSTLQPILGLWPAPHRILWCFVCAALCLPYFGSTEWLLRGRGPAGVWLPILGKLLTLAVLFVAAALRLLPFVFLLGMSAIALAFLMLEIFAYRLSRVAPAPWVAALFQAGWVGWALGALFPLEG